MKAVPLAEIELKVNLVLTEQEASILLRLTQGIDSKELYQIFMSNQTQPDISVNDFLNFLNKTRSHLLNVFNKLKQAKSNLEIE